MEPLRLPYPEARISDLRSHRARERSRNRIYHLPPRSTRHGVGR